MNVWTGVVTGMPSRSTEPSTDRRCASSSVRRTLPGGTDVRPTRCPRNRDSPERARRQAQCDGVGNDELCSREHPSESVTFGDRFIRRSQLVDAADDRTNSVPRQDTPAEPVVARSGRRERAGLQCRRDVDGLHRSRLAVEAVPAARHRCACAQDHHRRSCGYRRPTTTVHSGTSRGRFGGASVNTCCESRSTPVREAGTSSTVRPGPSSVR